jgi:zinc protease
MRKSNKFLLAILLLISKTAFSTSYQAEKWHTQNGVAVVFYQAMEVPMLDISLAFAAGSAYDGSQYGLSAMTSHMLNQGNNGKDATAIAQALADTGAQYNVENGHDMVVFDLRTLTSPKALASATNIFAEIINKPDFPAQVVGREKSQTLMAIKQSKESPEDIAMQRFFQVLYKDHPYAHPINGTNKTVNTFDRTMLLNFYKRYYVAHNALLVMVGAIDSKEAHALAEKLTQTMAKGSASPAIPKAKPASTGQTIQIPFTASQTVLRLGQVGIDHANPHYFPLMVGNYIVGGGALVSKLAIELREKEGLTYNVDSQFIPMAGEGPFIVGLSTRKQQTEKALDLTKSVLASFIQQGPSPQELEAAKRYLTGSFPLSLSSNKAIASVLLRMSFYHLPDDYLATYLKRIETVTKEDIQTAFKQQIDPNKLLLIEVGS